MFVQIKDITAKAADALDLVIEFSTLGEYGLEYPETMATTAEPPAPCKPGRLRPGGLKMRPPVKATPPPRTRTVTKGRPERRRTCATQTATSLPEALLPPRIRLDLTA